MFKFPMNYRKQGLSLRIKSKEGLSKIIDGCDTVLFLYTQKEYNRLKLWYTEIS